MRILGIDPGYAILWAAHSEEELHTFSAVRLPLVWLSENRLISPAVR